MTAPTVADRSVHGSGAGLFALAGRPLRAVVLETEPEVIATLDNVMRQLFNRDRELTTYSAFGSAL